MEKRRSRLEIGYRELIMILFSSIAMGKSISNEPDEYFIGATSTEPATRWEEAFLSGNGTMGVMVFGQPYQETVVQNHCKLYLPIGSREIVHDLAASMPEFRKAGLEAGIDGPAVVHRMMLEKTGQTIIGTDQFHPAFMLKLDMALQSDAYQNYVMTEDFRNGEIKVKWTDAHGD